MSGELVLLTKAALVRVLAQEIGLEELAGLLLLCFIVPLFSCEKRRIEGGGVVELTL